MTLEKVLSVRMIVAINILIILAVELTGRFFLETGLIHIIALLFLLLGISRIFVHYNSFDRFLVPFTLAAVTAMLLFAFSHIVEYLNFKSGSSFYADTIYVDVTNVYMTAMLLVALGAQYFISKKEKSWRPFWLIGIGFIIAGIVTSLGFLRHLVISIEPDEVYVYVYTLAVIGITFLSVKKMFTLGSMVSIMKDFAVYVAISFILIAVAALHYLLYDLLKVIGLPGIQIIYFSHFLFYAAISYIYLAFPHLASLGGIYPKNISSAP